MILHVNVTADHIQNGVRQDCGRCPIALALLDAAPRVVRTDEPRDLDKLPVFASPTSASAHVESVAEIFGYRRCLRGSLPEAAVLFIDAFDNRARVDPFEFDIEMEELPL
jgi:hypothetical protein